MSLDRNEHWALMCRRLPGGAWVLGPHAVNILRAACEDAAAYRTDQGEEGCSGCPTGADQELATTMGVAPVGKCGDHQFDDEAAGMYEYLLTRLGALQYGPPGTLSLLREALATVEEGHHDGQ
jgi:hypothetical protein